MRNGLELIIGHIELLQVLTILEVREAFKVIQAGVQDFQVPQLPEFSRQLLNAIFVNYQLL